MKKLTIIASAIVAVLAVSSCSNDELSELTTPQVEKGLPLKVIVTNNDEAGDDTRGVDITAINSYNMTAVYNTNNAWFKNVAFSKTGSVWGSTPAQTWSTDAGVTSAQFYAVSTDDGGTAVAAPPIGDNLKFSWTSSTTIADQKDLMIGRSVVIDGTTKTVSAIDKGETVNLNFIHGLTKVVVKPYALCYEAPGAAVWFQTNKGITGLIKSITFRNIATTGEYDFTTGEWSPSIPGDYKIEFDTPIEIQSILQADDPNDQVTVADIPTPTQNPLYFIPQQVTSWYAAATMKSGMQTKAEADAAHASYIEVEAIVAKKSGSFAGDDFDEYGDYESEGGTLGESDNWQNDENVQWLLYGGESNPASPYISYINTMIGSGGCGYGKCYIPLKAITVTYNDNHATGFNYNDVKFKPGKTLTLTLQIQNALGEDGTSVFGGQINTAVN